MSAVLVTLGCAVPAVKNDLDADPKILVREWTIRTHGPFVAGDRGFEYSNAVVHENTLIFGNRTQGLISLYPEINQVRWVLPLENGVQSELAVEKGLVFFGAGDGYLYAVNVENGKVKWRYLMRSVLLSRPTIQDGRLFVTSADDTVYGFDATTGQWLWHYKRRTSQAATIHAVSSPLINQGEVMVGLSDGYLVGLDLTDGRLKWEKKIHQGSKFTDVDAHPLVDRSVIYVPSYDGSLYALKRATRETLWRFDSGGSKAPVIDGSNIFLPSSDGLVYSLNRDSGKLNWKFELDGGVPTRLVMTDRYVIVGSSHRYLYVLDRNTGKGLYRYSIGNGSGFSGAPAFDPKLQRLYLLSGAGNLYAFKVRAPIRPRPAGRKDPYIFYESL